MNRLATFGLAVWALGATAMGSAAAAPVEDAIMGWLAAIGGNPDYTVAYDELTYDAASDTAVLSGLTVEYVPEAGTIAFQPITITGYVDEAGGTFGAASIVIDGAAFTSGEVEIDVNGINFQGLGNVAGDFTAGLTFDPDRPFSSMMNAYTPWTDIRLDHGGVDLITVETEVEGEYTAIVYEDLSVDGWADGRLASMTAGPMTMETETPDGPMQMTFGRIEGRDLDYAAFLSTYNPDPAAAGATGPWRQAAATVGYYDLVVSGPDFGVSIGAIYADDLEVRQPAVSIAPFFDKVMLDPDAGDDPTPEDMRALSAFLGAFSIGRMGVEDMHVAGDDFEMALAGVTLTSFSAEGLEEFAIDAVDAEIEDGAVQIGRLAWGGIEFPDLQAFFEAARAAEESGEDIDFAEFSPKIGFVEARDIDIAAPDAPPFALTSARLDLDNYVGPTPTDVALDIVGLVLPAELLDDEILDLDGMLGDLGYNEIRSDYSARIAWNEADETVTISDLTIAVADVASVSLSGVLGGVTREVLADPEAMDQVLETLVLTGATLTVEDDSLFGRWLVQEALSSGIEPAEFQEVLVQSLPEIAGEITDPAFQEQMLIVLETFIRAPGSITLTAAPPEPIPVIFLAAMAEFGPDAVASLLGANLTGVAGDPLDLPSLADLGPIDPGPVEITPPLDVVPEPPVDAPEPPGIDVAELPATDDIPPPSGALVGASNPERLKEIIDGLGYPATLDVDVFGDPQIIASAGGTEFRIDFYGCTDNANCDTLLFVAEYDADVELDLINEWNSDQFFGRAYLSGFTPLLEMGVNTIGGISEANFESVLDDWTFLMADFEDRIGY